MDEIRDRVLTLSRKVEDFNCSAVFTSSVVQFSLTKNFEEDNFILYYLITKHNFIPKYNYLPINDRLIVEVIKPFGSPILWSKDSGDLMIASINLCIISSFHSV